MEKEIDLSIVHQICTSHLIEIRAIKPVTGSFGKKLFFINQEFLLRLSEASMEEEQKKFKRIASLDFVPKIIHTGMVNRENGPIYYILLTLLTGIDFVNACQEISEAQQNELGKQTAKFLDNLHKIKGPCYDIGLYIAALPKFPGTWREGHQKYWDLLRQDFGKLPLKPNSIKIFERAFQYLQASSAVLEFQTGPKLLHNDFHPQNVLLAKGVFSGVIDWECSQFGEADFELCHLIHWCLYPPNHGIDFRPFLRALFETSPQCTQVPHLAKRMTLYQIEHELQQIIWNVRDAESWRVPRLVRWMDGGVDGLLKEIGSPVL